MVNKYVLDASFILKLLSKETDSERVYKYFTKLNYTTAEIYEPDFLKIEVYSVMQKKYIFKHISSKDRDKSITVFRDLLRFKYVQEENDLLDTALHISHSLKLITIYDTIYLALAELIGGTLVTCDREFYLKGHLYYTKLLMV